MNGGQPLSVLWPADNARPSRAALSDMAFADLELGAIVAELARDAAATPGRQATRERYAHHVLSQLLTEPEIIEHRQAVLADLLERPALCEALEAVVPGLEALADAPRGERYRPTVEPGLERVARRLSDLELLVETVGRLSRALDAARPGSAGLRSVAEGLRDLRSGAECSRGYGVASTAGWSGRRPVQMLKHDLAEYSMLPAQFVVAIGVL